MKARLSAVQQALFLLLFTALLFGIVARPQPSNRRFMDALDEMTTFRDGFKRAPLEQSLLEYARAQGAVQLSAVQSAAHGPAVPKLTVAKSAPPLQPTAAVELRTLADVHARAQPNSTLSIGFADAQAIGSALAWRLARMPDPSPWTLSSAEIKPAALTQADVDLEREVAQLRLDSMAADKAVSDATKKLEGAEQVFEARRKWKLPWKALVKFDEARKAAGATLEERQQLATDTQKRYEQKAQAALNHRPASQPVGAAGPAPQPAAAFALVALGLEHAATHVTIEVPAALSLRDTPVPSLRGGEFAAARAAGLWDELKDKDADQALAAIRAHFNWHYRYIELLGIRFGGMTVLQFMPCLLPLVLVLLVVRMRAVRAGYNPFGTTIDSSLPRVGFRSRTLDFVVVIVLPFVAAASAATSLLLIGQVPVLPVLSAIACLLLGSYAFGKLGDLQALVEAVVHSHSSHPPADAVNHVPVADEQK
jgi:hypothetical protein